MDTKVQYRVLSNIVQVKQMLIAHVNPILQVMHSIGGQFKYRGHNISFPREIQTFLNIFP